MIAPSELYPGRKAVVKHREDLEGSWGKMRIEGKHHLGDRAGEATFTLFKGWIHPLPDALPEDQRFICVSERPLPDTRVMFAPNWVNVFGLSFALLALYLAFDGKLYSLMFVALTGVYVWFIRNITQKIEAGRKRSQERVYKNHGDGKPPWVANQLWVAWTESEVDKKLFERMGELQNDLIGYEVGLACANGQAWLVVDDPLNQGLPPLFGADRLYLLEPPPEKENAPKAEVALATDPAPASPESASAEAPEEAS